PARSAPLGLAPLLSLASCSARYSAAPLSSPRALLGSSPPRALPTPPARSHRAGTHAPHRGTGTLHAWPCHARARAPHGQATRPLPSLTPHSAACPRRRVTSARPAHCRR